MNQQLIKVSNRCFYEGSIKTGYRMPPGKMFLGLEKPFLFIDVNVNAFCEWDGTSGYNRAEIAAMRKFLEFWLAYAAASKTENFHPSDIAIITPYAAQRSRLQTNLESLKVGKNKYYMADQVLSVDQSQGREFGLVFISTVRTSTGRFLSDYRRINVALTRAQHGLVIFGHRKTLQRNKMWSYMLKTHKKQVFPNVTQAIAKFT